jgi:hypothetical protein
VLERFNTVDQHTDRVDNATMGTDVREQAVA